MEGQDLIAIGMVRTSYGVKGDIKVSSYSGETEHFFALKEVFLRRGAVQKHFDVERVQELNGDILLKLRTLDSPEAAKMYATWDVVVPREFASPLEEGEFYYCDLFGSVLIHNGSRMGVVKSVIDNGASALLEIECDADADGKRRTVLVPFLDQFIGQVDIKKKTVELKETWFFE